MDICLAFTAMLQDVRFGDVSERQVDGILDWHDLVRRASQFARQLHASPDGLEVTFTGAAVHRAWRTSSQDILAALERQAEEAARLRVMSQLEAEEETRLAGCADTAAADELRRSAAASARAASARQAAAADRTAAVIAGDTSGGLLARAGAHDAAAAAADAEAAAAEAAAARLHAEAEQHRANAAASRKRASDLMQWEIAARDAHAAGTRLIAGEDVVAARVFEGIQAAGGVRQVPEQKRYASRDRAPALTGGGTR